MKLDEAREGAAAKVEAWDTASHANFYSYYEQQSLSEKTMERFRLITEALLRLLESRQEARTPDVLDVGCGAGAQSKFWLEFGHRHPGIDINRPLIDLACARADHLGSAARFDAGTATQMPVPAASIDACLLPDLLEHVADWRGCLDEAARVLRSGGLMYINTSSKLCPRQQEFDLPLYSWYPGPVKRYFERRSLTDWPSLVNHATYPAVNWFSYYGLRRHLDPMGFDCLDRFDLVDTRGKGAAAKAVLGALRRSSLLRWLGHVTTPYTLVVAVKRAEPLAHSVSAAVPQPAPAGVRTSHTARRFPTRTPSVAVFE